MKLLYFAWVRQRLGTGAEQISPPAGVTTVRELVEHLRSRGGAFPEVFSDLTCLRTAVDQEHAGWDTPLESATEIAFFPPVTGG